MDVRNLLSTEPPTTSTKSTIIPSSFTTSQDSKSTANPDPNTDRVSEITSPTFSKDKSSPDYNICKNVSASDKSTQLQDTHTNFSSQHNPTIHSYASNKIELSSTNFPKENRSNLPHHFSFRGIMNNQVVNKNLPPIPPQAPASNVKPQPSNAPPNVSPPCPPTLQLPENILNYGSPINSQAPTPTDMINRHNPSAQFLKNKLSIIGNNNLNNTVSINNDSKHTSSQMTITGLFPSAHLYDKTQTNSARSHLPIHVNSYGTQVKPVSNDVSRIMNPSNEDYSSASARNHPGRFPPTYPSAVPDSNVSQANGGAMIRPSGQPAHHDRVSSFSHSAPTAIYQNRESNQNSYRRDTTEPDSLKRILYSEPLSPRKRQRSSPYTMSVMNTTKSSQMQNTMSQMMGSASNSFKPNILPSPEEILNSTPAEPLHQVSYQNGYSNNGRLQNTPALVGGIRQVGSTNQRAGGSARVRCNICFRTFSGVSSHNRHVSRTHLNSRPFECPTCKLPFGQKGSLDRHVSAVHEKKRPFPCEECGKSFGRKDNLRVHIHTVHLKYKPFQCEFCYRPFGNRRPLRVHLETVHLKLKQLECDLCHKRFLRSSQLKVHMQQVHEREMNGIGNA